MTSGGIIIQNNALVAVLCELSVSLYITSQFGYRFTVTIVHGIDPLYLWQAPSQLSYPTGQIMRLHFKLAAMIATKTLHIVAIFTSRL